jgi:hypothetical protein
MIASLQLVGSCFETRSFPESRRCLSRLCLLSRKSAPQENCKHDSLNGGSWKTAPAKSLTDHLGSISQPQGRGAGVGGRGRGVGVGRVPDGVPVGVAVAVAVAVGLEVGVGLGVKPPHNPVTVRV